MILFSPPTSSQQTPPGKALRDPHRGKSDFRMWSVTHSHGPPSSRRASGTQTGEKWGIYSWAAFSPSQCPVSDLSRVWRLLPCAPFWKEWKEKGGESLLDATNSPLLIRSSLGYSRNSQRGQSFNLFCLCLSNKELRLCSTLLLFKDSVLFLPVFGKLL